MRNNVLNSKHTNNNTMESFYEDNNAQFVPSTTNGVTTGNGNGLKRPATLELNLAPGKARKTRYNASVTMPSVLPSPDMQMLKLVSPELEKIISTNATLPTPTPSAIIFPPSATSEQQQFAKGFEDALLSIHKKDTTSKLNPNNNNNSSTSNNNNGPSANIGGPAPAAERLCPPATVAPTTVVPVVGTTANNLTSTVLASGHNNGMSGGEITYTNLDYPGVVKEEPQAASSNQSPPVSPIDMESQERIKLERKRLRNRVAASKCRRRKLERISKLEDRVKELKAQNSELSGVVCNLKQHIFQLKQQVIEHHNNGCTITLVGKF
ncbi:transcription factor Jra [Anopheles maculipalpis]|uniref:transcription factor Jra n=1 Tax=Anopheles maculipalpis TaxID=1496333 RepID=UPI002158D6BE|nr:transcription factor Jra [Anopheles maculipalpis]XP_050075120.1 transcription factor Jra [Anopheles maculipalpis]